MWQPYQTAYLLAVHEGQDPGNLGLTALTALTQKPVSVILGLDDGAWPLEINVSRNYVNVEESP